MRKILCLCFVLTLCLCSCKSSDYKEAVALYDAGEYGQAIAAFEALGDYEDSAAKIEACKIEIQYYDAVALMEAAQYEDAIALFEALDGYKDSISNIEECETALLEQKYHNAVACLDSGNIIEAYDSLIALDGYKDSAEKVAAIYAEYEVAKLQQANVGDCVVFGTYEQDNDTSNGKEAIEWIVLSKTDTEVTVLSKFALEYQPFHTSNSKVNWETCSLREWLNHDFMKAAFSAEETSRIQPVWHKLVDSKNSKPTCDQVYLLGSVRNIDNKTTTQCKPTAYAAANSGISADDYCSWWLFDDTFYDSYWKNYFARIVEDEGIDSGTYSLVINKRGVRPAMQISIET